MCKVAYSRKRKTTMVQLAFVAQVQCKGVTLLNPRAWRSTARHVQVYNNTHFSLWTTMHNCCSDCGMI